MLWIKIWHSIHLTNNFLQYFELSIHFYKSEGWSCKFRSIIFPGSFHNKVIYAFCIRTICRLYSLSYKKIWKAYLVASFDKISNARLDVRRCFRSEILREHNAFKKDDDEGVLDLNLLPFQSPMTTVKYFWKNSIKFRRNCF